MMKRQEQFLDAYKAGFVWHGMPVWVQNDNGPYYTSNESDDLQRSGNLNIPHLHRLAHRVMERLSQQ